MWNINYLCRAMGPLLMHSTYNKVSCQIVAASSFFFFFYFCFFFLKKLLHNQILVFVFLFLIKKTKKFFFVFTCFLKTVLKNNYTSTMIKNKGLYIKIIFKIYLKILKINYKYFRFSNRLLFYKLWDNNF